jgi:hypothetical protein
VKAIASLAFVLLVCASPDLKVLGGAADTSVRRYAAQDDLHAPLERLLDTYVRQGLVYYRTLRSERGALDRYIASLNVAPATLGKWSAEARQAFWINAYNALVLRTVVNAYPIAGKSPDYPSNSIRQIPGAFERVRHPVAGKTLTLDEIEQLLMTEFGDARLLLALGRGAIDSPRLKSEAYTADRLDAQLTLAVQECAIRVACVEINRGLSTLKVTPLIGWREAHFIRTFGEREQRWPDRSPIERAVMGMVYPHLFPREQELLLQSTMKMVYGEFNWQLNELTGR